MTKQEFYNLCPGDLVVCNKEDVDMPFGRNKSLSEMVGLHLRVENLTNHPERGYGIRLAHPNDTCFWFNHTHVEVVNNNPMLISNTPVNVKSFVNKGYNYKQIKPISSPIIAIKALESDYLSFKKLVSEKQSIEITKKLYKQIKKSCPRIIGVLISNNILQKTKEK